jgi:hypothetical protein
VARVGPLAGRDIDALFYALRPRIIGLVAGTPGAAGPAGPKGVVWRGAWAADTDYNAGDIVTDETDPGTSPLTFFCITDHTSLVGTPPTVGGDTNWHEINSGYLFTDGSRPYVLNPSHTPTEGCLAWDPGASLERLQLDVDNATQLPYGGVYVRVKNDTGNQLLAFAPVRVASAAAGVLQVASAGTISGDEVFPIGLTMHAIDDGEEGWVCCHGHMGGVDTSAFSAGDVLYVGPTGDLGTSPPAKGCGVQIRMGAVILAADPGTVYVDVERMPILGDLSDCDVDSPQYYDHPQWLPVSEECDAWRDYPASLFPQLEVTEDYEIIALGKDVFLLVDASGGTVTLTLPTLTGSTAERAGRVLYVKKVDASANPVVLDGDGYDIDGEPMLTLAVEGDSVAILCDRTYDCWRVVVGAHGPAESIAARTAQGALHELAERDWTVAFLMMGC